MGSAIQFLTYEHIRTYDSSRTTFQEKLWGVKMTPTDDKFYEQQCINLQPGYCRTFVHRKWRIISLRKKHENDILEKSRESFQVLLFICHFSLVCLALFVMSDHFFYNPLPPFFMFCRIDLSLLVHISQTNWWCYSTLRGIIPYFIEDFVFLTPPPPPP